VSVSIVVMQVTTTLHPPGGATAVLAVVGSPALIHMGYLYVPLVAFGASLMLLIALMVDNLVAQPDVLDYPSYWV